MSDFVWTPSTEVIDNANITRLMQRLSFNVDPRRGMILTWYVVNHGKRCPTIAQVREGR